MSIDIEHPTGEILAWTLEDRIPDGWWPCLGGEASRIDDEALYRIVGTIYGRGNGKSTFNLPSLGHVALDENLRPFGCWIIKR